MSRRVLGNLMQLTRQTLGDSFYNKWYQRWSEIRPVWGKSDHCDRKLFVLKSETISNRFFKNLLKSFPTASSKTCWSEIYLRPVSILSMSTLKSDFRPISFYVYILRIESGRKIDFR
jgi:hypothetical protein